MSTFLDYTGLSYFKKKLDNLFATKESLDAVNARVSNLIDITGTGDDSAAEVIDGRTGYDGASYASIGDAIRAADKDFDARLETLESLDAEIDPDDLGLEQDEETNYVYPTFRGVRSSNGIYIAAGSGGGGGSSGNNAVLTVTNTTGWLSHTITTGASCELSLSWSSLEDGVSTGSGTMTVTVGGTTKLSQSVAQGSVTVDVSSYLSSGSNKVKMKITDVYDNSKTVTFTITVVALRIESYFSTASTFTAGSAVSYTYIPYGAVEKTVYFVVDGTTVGTSVVTASGVQQSYSIPAAQMTHGAHTLLVYFTATVDGETVTSNELYYSLIVVDSSSDAPIIASSFRDTTATQYATISIPYTVYTPVNLISDIELYAKTASDSGYVLVTELTVDRTEQTWNYRADTVGALSLMITTGTTAYTIALTVSSAGADIGAVTDDLVLYLTSAGRSNNEADPSVWEDTTNNISCTLSNFNFTSDGWVNDDDGVTVLRVAGDARVTIPYEPFANDFRTTGKTIELEFATRNVMTYDAAVISCMNGGRGFQLTAQNATLASEQSSIGTQYKEDEHVRISFVAEKTNENRLLYIYINSIMSGVLQYPVGDDFSQSSPVGISIGSNYCTTDIYNIRIYDNDLTRHQILGNWIADTQDITTMLNRYTHNNIYDEYWSVSLENLPGDLPYLVMSCAELPQYKGDKKTISGYYVDPIDASRSFSFDDASADVQGTSSAGYPRKNYKIKFSGGFTMTSSGETASKFAMNTDAIPTKTFTFKADVASSEGANNVELVRLYNDICPYKTPPQEEDSRVRQGIDGFPIVIFWNNTTTGETTFVGKYNFNNDKGTEEVFGFEDGDESWEIKNNTGNRVLWKSADYSGSDWLNDFEGRYPDGNEDPTSLAALAAWLVTTDQTAATGNALASSYTDVDGTVHTVDNAAYRLAKFKTEAWDYLEKDSTIFYYLFTELFLMVDSRAKNAFPSFLGEDKWCWLPYDMDTAIGINNEGALVFDYSLEDIDQVSGADVYNGQQSVLWVNLRQAFYDDIKSMYQNLRSAGTLSYSVVENMFETHQAKWPEAIFNEDSWFKYIDPLVNEGKDYLGMAQGSKSEQRKWWLYNRFRYIDSKYNAGDSLTDAITLRAYAKDNITVTPYATIYPAIKYGSYLVSDRGLRNVPTTLVCPLDNMNDTEVYIYSSSQLASIGDLSGLKVGLADLSNATKLQNLKLGDSDSSYSNFNLYSLTLGNNVLLQTIDVRNCAGLGDTTLDGHNQTSVDISGCSNIEHVYFGGTNVRSVTLPNGGILKTLQLPGTITSLVIQNQPLISTFEVNANNVASKATYTSGTITSEGVEETSATDYRSDYISVRGGATHTASYDTSAVSSITVNEYAYNEGTYTFVKSTIVLNGGSIVVDSDTTHVRICATTSSADDASGVELCSSPYSNVSTLRLEGTGTGVPYLDILRQMPSGSRVRLIGFTMTASTKREVDELIDILDTMRGMDENGNNLANAVVSGTITGLGSITQEWYDSILERYPNLVIEYEEASGVIQRYLERTMIDLDGDSVKTVGRYAFYNRSEFTAATLGATSIGEYAFGNSGLTTLDLVSDDAVTIAANAFNGAWNLQHLIIRSSTVSTLSATSAFTETKLGTLLEGAIYVPASLVNDYKEATNWSTYAGIIHPISAYPLTDFSTITDSWEAILSNANYATDYAVGDTKLLDVNGTQIYMRIAAIDTDTLASDSSSTASITWVANDILTTHKMNSSNTTTGGWPSTEMRSWLRDTILPTLPQSVQNGIKEVNKTYYDYASTSTLTGTDTIWIPSMREAGMSTEDSGVVYSGLFPTQASRIKYSDVGSAANWWLRSAASATSFYIVTVTGTSPNYGASISNGVVFGFCT